MALPGAEAVPVQLDTADGAVGPALMAAHPGREGGVAGGCMAKGWPPLTPLCSHSQSVTSTA